MAKRLKLVLDPVQAAKSAGLSWVCDDRPGLRRQRRGKNFRYLDAQGRPIRDEKILERIRKLAIPPAWENVWICADADGHIQATGRDARGRKQYRYHTTWRSSRDETKYHKLIVFGGLLPKMRARVEQDLARPGLRREKVLATVVRLLETTLIRVGNEEYARDNASYGLTTMRTRHVDVQGEQVSFEFRGKSGVQHRVTVRDRRLAKIVRRCQELPGQELFQCVDGEGRRHVIDSQDVNLYLKEISGEDITAKDFRTWNGTVLAATALRTAMIEPGHRRTKKTVNACIERVARQLGNTKAVCRRCYVSPAVVDAYLDGSLARAFLRSTSARPKTGLLPDEHAVLKFLQARSGRTALQPVAARVVAAA
jgi:DNA topoisomerase I